MSYIQNPTSNLKNAIDELARKYGKEFNGDVNAFVEASKHESTNGGVENYVKQVFDMVDGGEPPVPPIPTPTITVNDITGVSEDGITNATTTVTITDGDGWNVVVTTDGTIVTAASLNDTTLTYTVAMNSSTERSGSITITLSRSGEEDVAKTISVTQNAYIAPTVTIGPVSEAPAAGGTFSTTLTITNGDGWIKVIQRDANVITSASISGSTLTYTIAENTAYDTRSTTLSVVLMKANRTQVSDSATITQEASHSSDVPLEWIKFTKGGYINTGKIFEVGDRIQFTFSEHDISDVGMVFGVLTKTGSTTSHRLTFHRASNGNANASCLTSDSGSGGRTFFMGQFRNNSKVYIDFNYASTSSSDYIVKEYDTSTTYSFNSSYRPTYNSDYAIYLNSYNYCGTDAYTYAGLTGGDMTIYEYKVIDTNGVTKIHLVPVLHNGSPMFYDNVTGNYIDISIISGFNPTITYA